MAKRPRVEEQLIAAIEDDLALLALGSDDADHLLLLLGHIGRRAPFLEELIGNACADATRLKSVITTLQQRTVETRKAI